MKTYYEILGVSVTASFDEVKRAFRSKAKECHPDHHGHEQAEQEFKELNEAYDCLKDDQKRAAYDRVGHDAYVNGGGAGGFGGFGGFDFGGAGFENIFEEMFGMGGRARSRSTAQSRGDDLRYDITIELAEAYIGVKKTIPVETYVACDVCDGKGGKNPDICPTCAGHGHVRRQNGFFIMETECPKCHATGHVLRDPCHTCHGAGRVRKKRNLEVAIPAGVDTGLRMRLSGEGDAALNGGIAGDLYVFLTVKEHPFFVRSGADLACTMPITMTMATLGGAIDVPTLSGEKQSLEIKPGTQSGAVLKMKGQGMPTLKSVSLGDMYVTIQVETPTHLTARQKELMREFEEASDNDNGPLSDLRAQIKKIFG